MSIKTKPIVTADSFSKAKHIIHGLTLAQRREILQTLGSSCLILFEHYMYKANAKTLNFDDDKVAKEIGLTERTVRRARQVLVRNGLFFQCVASSKSSNSIPLIFIGYDTVSIYRKNPGEAISKVIARCFGLEKQGFTIKEIK